MAKRTSNNRRSAQTQASKAPEFDGVFREALAIAFKRPGKGKNAGSPVNSLQLKEANANAQRTKWSLYRWLSRVYTMFDMTPDVSDMLTRIKGIKDSKGQPVYSKIGGDQHNGFAIYRPGYTGTAAGSSKVAEELDNDLAKLKAQFGLTD